MCVYVCVCVCVCVCVHTRVYVCTLGNELKLDNCVSAVMLGFQSIDNAVKSTQFMYQEGKQIKFCSGEYTGLFKYLLDHFCCPNGTVSDMSCNPEGTYYKNTYIHVCLYVKICQYADNGM